MRKDFSGITAFDLGYAIGLYEGEGSINVISDGHDRVYPRMVIRMTDREPVEFMYRLFGGRFMGPYTTPSESARGYKPKYRWALGTVEEFIQICWLFFPHLSPRRQDQIAFALTRISPLIERVMVAGTRRNGTKAPYRGRRSGELVCPETPEPSTRGYQRHRRLGIPVCEACRASYNLWAAARRVWYADKIKISNREQRQKNLEARRAYDKARYWRLKHEQG